MKDSAEERRAEVEQLLGTLSDAQTLVRSARSTIVPPRGATEARLNLLEKLKPAPHALEWGSTLGEGGMGVVREATQVALDRRVAVKTVRGPGEPVESLLAEALVSGRLEHPNIIPVHDLTLDANGLPALVMRKVEGVAWTRLLKDPGLLADFAPGKPPLDEHLRILIQACHALEFAHSKNVVHRDLKPDNVMVGRFGEVFIVDWGIASSPGPTAHLAGTPAYMAPEMVCWQSLPLGPHTDVYLIGSTLYEVLAGRPPHEGSTPEQMVNSMLSGKRTFPPEAPAELVELVRHCMQSRPEARPGSVAAVRAALEDFLRHQGSRELTARTEARLDELLSLLRSGAASPETLASVFSECRFGFQQALLSWAGNARAREGLEKTVAAMIRHHVAHGSAGAARTLLAELPDAGRVLEKEVAEALQSEKARGERLEQLARGLDPKVGGRSGLTAAIVLGVLWALAPLFGNRFSQDAVLLGGAGVAALSAVIVIGMAWKVPDASLMLSRQLLRFVAAAMIVEVVGLGGMFVAGVDPGRWLVPLVLGYWCVMCLLIAVTLVARGWPTVIAYAVLAAAAAKWPQLGWTAATLANLALLLNVLWMRHRLTKLARAPS